MDISASRPYRVTLGEFTVAFVPFALLLSAALLIGDTAPDPGFARTVYTIWVTAALVTPALAAFVLPSDTDRVRSTWLLFWTFSFVTYVVHMSYAVLSVYHGSAREFLAGQGVFPAVINVLFTLWWALDLALAWLYHGRASWLRYERIGSHVFIGLTFFASTVILKHGFVNVIGIVMTGVLLVCLAARYDARTRATSDVPEAPGVVLPPNVTITGPDHRLRTRG